MRHTAFILLLGTLIFASCTKNDHLTYWERKAIGQYTFEKVVIHDGFLNSTNVTQRYHNMILQLNEKKEAALIDRNNDITYFGKYDVVTQQQYTDDDGNTTNNTTIIIDIRSEDRGNAFYWVGKNATVNNNRIRFTSKKADGKYVFKLNKI